MMMTVEVRYEGATSACHHQAKGLLQTEEI